MYVRRKDMSILLALILTGSVINVSRDGTLPASIQPTNRHRVFFPKNSPMNPAGYFLSVLTLPSILMALAIRIFVHSVPVKAYFSRFLTMRMRGRHSLALWGPGEGRGANTPPNLSNSQFLGAHNLFRCFFGPRACHWSVREIGLNRILVNR